MHREDVKEPDAGGGDLHLISSCASGRITRVMLADVCGIGSMFADISCNLRDVMKNNVNTIRQDRIVRDASETLELAAMDGGYASMLIATYFAPTRSLSVCNTGHPCPVVYRASTGEWETLKQMPSPLTAQTSELVGVDEYQQLTTKLSKGDLFLCFSNVLAECRDAGGRTLGHAGVRKLMSDLDAGRPAQLLQQLREIVCRLHPDNGQACDTTMILFQATDTGVGWKENLMAPLRILRGVHDRTSI